MSVTSKFDSRQPGNKLPGIIVEPLTVFTLCGLFSHMSDRLINIPVENRRMYDQ